MKEDVNRYYRRRAKRLAKRGIRNDDKIADKLAAAFGNEKPVYPNKPDQGELTKADIERGFFFRRINGNNVAFDVETGEMVFGQPKAIGNTNNQGSNGGSRSKTTEEMLREGAIEGANRTKRFGVSKDGWSITHFERDGRILRLTRPLAIGFTEKPGDPRFVIHKGDVSNVIVFASSDYGDEVKIKDYLSETCGGSEESWKHMTGDAVVSSFDGKKYKAQVHFFESDEVGQTGWKIKALGEELK